MRTRSFRRLLLGKGGQTAVEYILTTLTLVTVFAGMYGFLQGQLKILFQAAGMAILTPYCGGPCN
jgi:Flp pilus assembly pilin Flp